MNQSVPWTKECSQCQARENMQPAAFEGVKHTCNQQHSRAGKYACNQQPSSAGKHTWNQQPSSAEKHACADQRRSSAGKHNVTSSVQGRENIHAASSVQSGKT